jgi:4-hydroxyphenylpyruvate dioxygenase
VDGIMKRAEQLQVSSFTEPLGPGELQMQSIRGVGGSLIYFMREGGQDLVWNDEFVTEQSAQGQRDAGLQHVDYIAQTMQYEEMLSWLLYYLCLFEVGKTPQAEIADPVGWVYSQAVQSPDGKLRITLNGSAAAETLSTRFLQGFMGAGVQHIALATHDIFATARRLREYGLETLPIPANYYEDVQARFGLDAETTQRLAEFNILYDREGEGECFQLYSRAFAKRFFFEIIERRNYGSYGIANAPIRLAAQSRYKATPAGSASSSAIPEVLS